MGGGVAQDRSESGLTLSKSQLERAADCPKRKPQKTSPTSELVGPMGRHERIVPGFAQKRRHRSGGQGACVRPDNEPNV
jgi:hypothetical protein